MTDAEYARKLDELDTLLNDPDVPMQPARIWSLLAELSSLDADAGTGRVPPARARFGASPSRSIG